MDYEMAQKHKKKADAEKFFEVRLALPGRFEDSPESEAEKNKNNRNSQKSPLFRESRENKIRFVLRQKFQARLDAVADSPSENSAGPHRNHGLQGVVSGSAGVAKRVKKSQNPRLLVRLQNINPGNPAEEDGD